MSKSKASVQMIWGVVLTVTGVFMFLSIPRKMVELENQFSLALPFLRFCFYLIAVLLAGGGAKKIIDNYKGVEKKDSKE